MKAGDRVYRVVSDLNDDDNEWCVQGVALKTFSTKMLQLVRPFTGLMGVRYTPSTSLGRLFFATEAEAIRDFAIRQRDNAERLERQKATAHRALKWALAQAEQRIALIEEALMPRCNVPMCGESGVCAECLARGVR
jgi:hypothetical protein